jgi:UDP-glucose 4-epimerase
MPKKTRSRVFAVTGAKTFLGRGLIRHLAQRKERVVALDIRKPDDLPEGVGFYRVDLTLPTADALLAQLFQEEGVTDLVHLAFLGKPRRDEEYAHELVVIGTMHVCHAVQSAGIERMIVRSSTLVYGAHPDNPNYLREDFPLRGVQGYRWIQDLIEAEKIVQELTRRTSIPVTTLRFAPILGPTIQNLYARIFSSPAVWTLLGYDPLYQLLHEEDALKALLLAINSSYRGPLNIAGRGVLPLSTLIYLSGKFNLPLPKSIAFPLVQALWVGGVSPYPPQHLDYLHYLCVADGEQAEKALGFTSRYTLRETIESFSASIRGRELRAQIA